MVCELEPCIRLHADSADSVWDFLSPSLCPSPTHTRALSLFLSLKKQKHWGAWVTQSVNCLTSAQVMISQFVGSSSVSGPVLTAQGLETASDSVSPSLSAPSRLTHSLSLSLSKINKC